MFGKRDDVIWMNGELVPWNSATTHILSYTLQYGMGVFEGLRAYHSKTLGTCIFRLPEHTDRLLQSAHILNIRLPVGRTELIEAQKRVVRENQLKEGYVRPMVFLGSEGFGLRGEGLRVNVAVAAWTWPHYVSEDSAELGIEVRTSSFSRHHVNSAMCKAKANGHYINSILALHEALDSGADAALLLDTHGYVAEGAGENFFMVRNGRIITPEPSACLSGITRDAIITLARGNGYEVIEKRITRDEVYCADEAFFTGTAAEVLPIRKLDGRVIGAGRRGEVCAQLQTLFFDVTRGRIEEHHDWLTPIEENRSPQAAE